LSLREGNLVADALDDNRGLGIVMIWRNPEREELTRADVPVIKI
jgi:hypothetical protein